MRVDLFDFDLPEERIALRPASPRDSARMLVVHPGGNLEDKGVLDLPAFLRPGDVLVSNDTRVLPAQLFGTRGEAKVGVTLHKRVEAKRWHAFVRNAKRLKPGDRVVFSPNLAAVVEDKLADGSIAFLFECEGPVEAALMEAGTMPLPPYIASRRPADEQDAEDYQTVFARHQGSVAAPTAGLHFTERLLAALDERGVERATVTLHVGAGTFLPVKAEDTAEHKMHAEWGEVTPEVAEKLNAAKARGGRIVCVGTTSLRLIESAADENGTIHPFKAETDIFITPGYRFRAVDVLMTNFHLPKSTLFMLVSAFSGLAQMKAAYAHAIANGYRFYSYGDASLLFRYESQS